MTGHKRWLGVLLLVAAAGCESPALETGYVPRPLNATDAERRAYYSSKYSAEAIKAEQERASENRTHRPEPPSGPPGGRY